MIEYQNIYKSYNDVNIISDLNLTVNDGEFLVFIGPSGCGKTTSLKMVNKLIKANKGKILVDGKDINDFDVVELRRKIGYVIQQIGLFPNMTVEENICVVPKLLKWSKEKRQKRAEELLELVKMPYAEYANKYPNELSGGQQQRIGVLRALAAEPPIILMDEPFGALDPITRDILQDELKAIQKKLKKTIVFVTHDMDEAVKMADRIIFMNEGKILQAASPEEMLSNPAHPLISSFMGRISYDPSGDDLTCEDIMRKKPFMVSKSRKVLECLEMMKKREIDSVMVIDDDDDDKFIGIATIEDIKSKGVPHQDIVELVRTDITTVLINTSAKDAFDKLASSGSNYIPVLNRDRSIAGIITRSSMTTALASLVWGEE